MNNNGNLCCRGKAQRILRPVTHCKGGCPRRGVELFHTPFYLRNGKKRVIYWLRAKIAVLVE